jgi:hypothetical protein
MPIPTLLDRQIGEVEDASAGILLLLRIMQRAAQRDLPLHRARLREMLADFNDVVMSTAPQ